MTIKVTKTANLPRVIEVRKGIAGPKGIDGTTDIINDTTPQLGGDLDANGHLIDGRDVNADGDVLDALAGTTHVNTFNGRSGTVIPADGDYDGSQIPFDPDLTIGIPTDITSIQGTINHLWSAGLNDGGDLTDNGNGTISISITEAVIRPTNDSHDDLKLVKLAGQGPITLTDDATNYIYLDYNSGTPIFKASTSIASYNGKNKVLAYIVHRDLNDLNYIDMRSLNIDTGTKSNHLFQDFSRFIHKAGGSIIGDAGSLSIAVTAGEFYFMTTGVDHVAFDTSIAGTANANVFDLHYRDGSGGWTHVANNKVIDPTVYDSDTGTPTALSSNPKFGVTWFYIVNDSPSSLAAVMGQAEYSNEADARAAAPPSIVPSILDEGLGVLVGFALYQKTATEFTDVLSPFTTTFTASHVTTHNSLGGLQGGTIDEYNHITDAELTSLQGVTAEIATAIDISKIYEDRAAFIASTTWTGHLKGVNLASGEFGLPVVPGVLNVNYTYPSTSEIDYFYSTGCRIIRLPFLWERLQTNLYDNLTTVDLNLIKALVTHATDLGMRIVLDPHNYSERYVSGTVYEIGSATVPWASWQDFCNKLGTEFKDNPLVIFLVMNEPKKTADQAFQQNQYAIDGFRSAGAANIIQCPGNNFAHGDTYLTNGNDVNLDLVDPMNNLHIEIHQYLNPTGNGEQDTVDSYSVGPQRLHQFTEYARANGQKVHVGEYNAGTTLSVEGSTELLCLREMQAYMEENDDVFVSSTMWAAGPWWPDDYRNSVNAVTDTSGTTDQTRLTAVLSITDAPFPHQDSIIDLDFANGKVYGTDKLSSVLTLDQAGYTYMQRTDGTWYIENPNTLRISERGLLSEEARTNYFKSIIRQSDSGLTMVASTLTNGFLAPDGSYNAFKITADTANNRHGVSTSTAWLNGLAPADVITLSTFCKFDTTTQYNYLGMTNSSTRVVTNTLGHGSTQPETSDEWVRSWYSLTIPATMYGIQFYLQPSQYPALGHQSDSFQGDGTQAMQFWTPQAEKGLFASTPIYASTLGVTATRVADDITIENEMLDLLKDDVTVIIEVQWLPQVAVDIPLLTLDATEVLKSTLDYKASGDMGVTQTTTAMPDGKTARKIPTKYGYSHRVTGTPRVTVGAEFASSVASDQTVTIPNTAKLGPVNGYIKSIQVYKGYTDATEMDTIVKGQ